ncbi:MAG: crossover junction endodeoxyribonuclease RuvC [Planctomycetia bacterium]|nr:crossover junction endodeoxyribonuclease RuvC [Planctomycetia bacterium]
MPSPAPPRRVLGIDPGTHVCGWGVVDRDGPRLVTVGFGVVRAKASDPIERRLATIAAGLRAVVATHRPDAAAVEDVFFGRDPRAAVRLGEGRGAALVVLADAGLPVAHYANNVVKRSVGGAGRAAKTGVQAMTRAILGLANLGGELDASDALALAICHHHRALVPATSPVRVGGRAVSPRIAAALEAAKAAERARPRRAPTAPAPARTPRP